MQTFDNRRVLIVDDNAAIHGDFKKILGAQAQDSGALAASEEALFGDEPAAQAPAKGSGAGPSTGYELTFALQGQEALAAVETARKEGVPFAVAFVDMRMPPGWDGVETIQQLWRVEPDLQVVVCTAFSDYSWPEMVEKLGRTDRMLILKKPFDAVEVSQLAAALTEKWNTTMSERAHLEDVKRAEMQARAYASSLETVNRALEASWARADVELKGSRSMLLRAADELLTPALSVVADSLMHADVGRSGAEIEQASLSAKNLAHALELFIELARINGAPAPTANKPVDAPALLAQVVASLDALQRPRVRVEAPPPVATDTLNSNAERLLTALREIVDNALRCSGDGEVCLRIEAGACDSRNEASLSFIVEDRGPGLSRDAQKRLFEPFSHAHVDGARDAGPGLGLALAKRIAETLGGGLSYEPSDRGGARFRLRLPVS
jgi:two-component system sensor histidine kinase/response regulator